MSIDDVMRAGLSALRANQAALRTVSDNIAHIDTPGHVRKDAQFQAIADGRAAHGVEARISRAADQYLQTAHLRTEASRAAAAERAQWLDRAQTLLGDPAGDGTLFSTLDQAFAAFSALTTDPIGTGRRTDAVDAVARVIGRVEALAGELAGLRSEIVAKVDATAGEINTLLEEIADLNSAIVADRAGGGAASAAENHQATLIDRLSELIDIRTDPRPLGGVRVRTESGLTLVDAAAGRISVATDGTGGIAVLADPGTAASQLPLSRDVRGGELAGLLALAGQDLPALQAELGAFATGIADAVNRAHNEAWPVPPPAVLAGRATGWLGSDNIGFSGVTRLGIVDADGIATRIVTVDFDAGLIRDGAGGEWAAGSDIASLVTGLDTALGAGAGATFAEGRLRLHTDSGGLVITSDAGNPAQRAGRGFAHAFGLNDLITTSGQSASVTVPQGSDAHGFVAGETVELAIRGSNGGVERRIAFTVGGTSVSDLVNRLNAALTGHASAALDTSGALRLTPTRGDGISLDVVSDATSRGDTGFSFTRLFGLGRETVAAAATGLRIRDDIRANPARLGTAMADLGTAPTLSPVLAPGDNRGALALEAIATRAVTFPGSIQDPATPSEHGARLAQSIGRNAALAEGEAELAAAMHRDIHERRQSVQGVDLDEELVRMTRYQQAYAAASRMLQASKELYEILLRIV